MKLRARTLLAVCAVALAAVALLALVRSRTVAVPMHERTEGIVAALPAASSRAFRTLSGEACETHEQAPRPIAVMLAGDTVTRPLSGIGQADLVVEMPVVTGSITRLMAVFQCTDSIEIGSIRSARDDFIPLAAAFDAIYAHWGGSHFALDELRRGVIDNIDALRNPFGAYWRKQGIPAPHNGFTSFERLRQAAEKLGYRTVSQFQGYPLKDQQQRAGRNAVKVQIGYPGPYRVEWRYNETIKRYLRFRGGTPEEDASSGEQVRAATVAVMRTTSRQIQGQYNDVRVTGEGEATVFRFGEAVEGTWHKDAQPLSAPLRFLDERDEETAFAKGPLWIEIVEVNTPVIVDANL